MERRLQLMSKEPRDKRLFQPLERWVPDTDDFWDLDIGDSHQTPTLKTPFSRSSKAQKRLKKLIRIKYVLCAVVVHFLGLCRICIYFRFRKCGFLDSKTQRSQGKSSRITPQKSDTRAASPCQRELRNKETPEKTAPARSSGPTEVVADAEESCENEDFSYMTTTEMYLCCWHQPPVSPLCEASPKKEDDVASKCFRCSNFLYKSGQIGWRQ